jgi:hypothetical protein
LIQVADGDAMAKHWQLTLLAGVVTVMLMTAMLHSAYNY